MARFSNHPCERCQSGFKVRKTMDGWLCEDCYNLRAKGSVEIKDECNHAYMKVTTVTIYEKERSTDYITELYCPKCEETKVIREI